MRCAAAVPSLLLLSTILAAGQSARPAARVSPGLRPLTRSSARHDVSPPLRTIPPLPAAAGEVREIPLYRPPKVKPGAPGTKVPSLDAALQAGPSVAAMPAPLVNFEGVNNRNGVLPPDTNGDIGPNHYVQIVNLSFAVFDRSGNVVFGPVNSNTLWSGFGGACESHNDGDPIVLYDRLADRWLISQFALYAPDGFHQCIAISQNGDPTGSYYRYDFLTSATLMNDYPKFGIWPDGYYMSINEFGPNGLAGAGVAVFDRARMLQGLSASMISFDLSVVNPAFGNLLPSDLDGSTPPPPGSPNYFIEVDDDAWGWPSDRLLVFQFHVDWSHPGNTTFTGPQVIDLTAAGLAFDSNLCNYSRACIPQPGGTPVDAISDRLMYRLAYRNFGDHESLVVNHTVDVDGNNHAGIRWYEIRNPGGSPPTVFQAGTFSPDGNHRWMGSMAMDRAGDIALGYSVSSTTVYPSIRYTGRLATDPLGTLPQGETSLIAGSGSQSSGYSRWGDYSMMGVDPVDDCTFWYTQEYYATDSSAGWQTRVGSFRFPTCTAAAVGFLSGTVTDAVTTLPLANAMVQFGAFSTVTDANGHYLLTAVAGTADATASATAYYPQTVAAVVVVANTTTTQDFALTPRPRVTVSGTVSDGSGHGWPLYARIHVTGDLPQTVFTNPVSGAFSVELLDGQQADLQVSAVYPGYQTETRTITPTTGDTENFALVRDPVLCTAPGYGPVTSKLSGPHLVYSQDFEASDGGYTIGGTNPSWAWGSNSFGAHSGTKVWGTTLNGGQYFNNEQSYITSPGIDLSGSAGKTVLLSWWQRLIPYSPDYGAIEVSRDGGSTWRTARRSVNLSNTMWTQYFYRLEAADLVADFRVRFRMQSDANNTFPGFYLDDVQIFAYDSEQPADTRLIELFEGSPLIAPGWEVSTSAGSPWVFNDGTGMNETGGEGRYAYAVSYGLPTTDTVLRTPPVNLSGLSSAVLQFHSSYGAAAHPQTADVDVSSDGGSTWANLWRRQAGNSETGPEEVSLDPYLGATSLLLRFHYTGVAALYWKIDDVRVGAPADMQATQSCGLLPGGLIVGNTFDANTGLALNGTQVAGGTALATSFATPDDDNLADGFFVAFSPAGTHTFTASHQDYANATAEVSVVADAVTPQNFSLPAGRVGASPSPLEVTVAKGGVAHLTLTVSNTGTAAADFKITTHPVYGSRPVSAGGFGAAAAGGEGGGGGEGEWADTLLRTAPSSMHRVPPSAANYVTRSILRSWSVDNASWGITPDDAAHVWVSNPGVNWGGLDKIFEFSEAGTKTGRQQSYTWSHMNGPADAAFDWNTEKLWVLDVGADNCIHEIDPDSGVTGNRICPSFGISQRGLAFDPTDDTWFIGGWNDSTIYHVDSSGAILQSVPVGLAISGLAYNPDTHHLFVMEVYYAGDDYGYPVEVVVLDAAAGFAEVERFQYPGIHTYIGAGLEMACDGSLWAVDQGNYLAYQLATGESTSVCQGVPWLSANPATGSVAAAGTQPIDVVFDASVPEVPTPGTYRALLRVNSDTPYGPVSIPVTMNVIANPNAPVAVNDAYSLDEDTTLTVTAPGVLANDSDPNGDPLTSVLVSPPAHGTLALAADGSFTYTPNANYHGSDSFTYHANDGVYNSNLAVVSLTINPVNDAPVASDDSYSIYQGATLSVSAPGVLANDTDVDGDPLTAVVVGNPAHGTLSLAANGSFTYTPDAGFLGGDTFTYRASDGLLQSNLATVNINVIGLSFVPVTPCRVADTRLPAGPFGGPFLGGGTTRSFAIPSSACSIPATAQVYSVNLTVVPHGVLGYLTAYPCGQALPLASNLNSQDGRTKAVGAVVPAGAGGAMCVYASNDTDLVIDINGYFVPDPGALAFYPLTPCRLVDTRLANGPLGGPAMAGNTTRTFPVLSSSCGVPAGAQAYSLNYTVVPQGGPLGYLTTWPAGQAKPLVSTLNAPTGAVTANAAIVPAGSNGDVSVFVTSNTHLVIDINGYFAPPGTGGLTLFPVTPCRVLDTRNPAGSPPIAKTKDVNVVGGACGAPASAQAFVLNATVVPTAGLGFLTLWPQGTAQPLVSTLNAIDGAVTSNLAVVPSGNGWVSAYPSNSTHLVVDVFGYFAPEGGSTTIPSRQTATSGVSVESARVPAVRIAATLRGISGLWAERTRAAAARTALKEKPTRSGGLAPGPGARPATRGTGRQ